MSDEIPSKEDLVNIIKGLQEKIASLEKPVKSKTKPKKKVVKKSPKKVTKKLGRPKKKKIEEVLIKEDYREDENLAIVVGRKPGSGAARMTKNEFKDFGTIASSDKIFNEKYGEKFSVGIRSKPPASIVEVKCNKCNATDKISSSLIKMRDGTTYYICARCAMKGMA